MPCHDYQSDSERASERWAEQKLKVDQLTALLCEVWNTLKAHPEFPMSDVMKAWGIAHDEMDVQRLRHEITQRLAAQERAGALAKLTDKERELLGLAPRKR
jgi:hypothetical protein